MLGVGGWALIKGALPERPFNLLLGKGDYRTSSRTARFFGSLLVLPFAAYILAVYRTVTGSEQAAIIFSTIHLIVFIIVLLCAILWARHIRDKNKA
jgi:uncharacterized membrane protein